MIEALSLEVMAAEEFLFTKRQRAQGLLGQMQQLGALKLLVWGGWLRAKVHHPINGECLQVTNVPTKLLFSVESSVTIASQVALGPESVYNCPADTYVGVWQKVSKVRVEPCGRVQQTLPRKRQKLIERCCAARDPHATREHVAEP